jgi:integrase
MENGPEIPRAKPRIRRGVSRKFGRMMVAGLLGSAAASVGMVPMASFASSTRKSMSRKKPTTPRSQVRSALRRYVWLRSRERRAALKRDKYTCVDCGAKQSKAKGREVKVEVDHLDGIEWERMIDYIYRHLLVPPERLETVCPKDHKLRGEQRKAIG